MKLPPVPISDSGVWVWRHGSKGELNKKKNITIPTVGQHFNPVLPRQVFCHGARIPASINQCIMSAPSVPLRAKGGTVQVDNHHPPKTAPCLSIITASDINRGASAAPPSFPSAARTIVLLLHGALFLITQFWCHHKLPERTWHYNWPPAREGLAAARFPSLRRETRMGSAMHSPHCCCWDVPPHRPLQNSGHFEWNQIGNRVTALENTPHQSSGAPAQGDHALRPAGTDALGWMGE